MASQYPKDAGPGDDLVIDGNVGIHTHNNKLPLTVNGNIALTSNNAGLLLKSYSGHLSYGLKFGDEGLVGGSNNLALTNRAPEGDLLFQTAPGGVERTRMKIDGTTGHVGIGTDDPGAHMLSVGGSGHFEGDVSLAEGKTVDGRDVSADGARLDAVEALLDAKASQWDGGSVGLDADAARVSLDLGTLARQDAEAVDITGGTITGVTNLQVAGDVEAQGSLRVVGDLEVTGEVIARDVEHHAGSVTLGDADDDTVTVHGVVRSSHSSGALKIEDALTVSGRVGIGTPEPGQLLHVSGLDSGNRAGIMITNTNSGGSWGLVVGDEFTGIGDQAFAIEKVGAPGGTPLVIKANGFVGIGTTEAEPPMERLHVVGNVKAQGFLWPDGRSAASKWSEGEDEVFYEGGNVGIGTPTPGAKLHVGDTGTSGTLVLGQNTSARNKDIFKLDFTGVSDGVLRLYQAGVVEAIRLNANGDSYIKNGNVGIGTTEPREWAKLDVNGFIAGSRLVVGNSMVFDKESYAVFGSNSAAHPVRIAADGDLSNDKGITVDYSGNVGIGTPKPGTQLHINEATDATVQIMLQNSHRATYLGYRTGNDSLVMGGAENFMIYDNDGVETFVIKNAAVRTDGKMNGNVGIGTTEPGRLLHVSGVGEANRAGVRITNTNSIGSWDLVMGDGATGIGDQTFAIERVEGSGGHPLVIKDNGNVGIGTTEKLAEKLEVAGNVKADAFIGDGSQLTGIEPSKWTEDGYHVNYGGRVGIGSAGPAQYGQLAVWGHYGTQDISRDNKALILASFVDTTTTDRNGQLYVAGTNFPAPGSIALVSRQSPDSGLAFATRADNKIEVRMAITGGEGNVGIGTTEFDNRLTVQSSGLDTSPFAIKGASEGHPNIVEFRDGAAGTPVTSIGELHLYNGEQQKVRISASGYTHFNGGHVGIGETEPGAPLEVRDRIGGANNTLLANFGKALKDSYNDGSAYIQISRYGNSPGDSLTLERNGGSQGPYRFGSSYNDAVIMNRGNADANHGRLMLGTQDNVALTIDGNGRVGIGTTKPAKELHIQGTSSAPFFIDGHDRSGLAITGDYPELDLFSGGINDARFGPTIRLGAYNDETQNSFKHWVMGTAGRDARFLDIGFSDKNDPDPHAGIRNHQGNTVLTLLENGRVGIGVLNPGGALGLKNEKTFLDVDGAGNLTFTDDVAKTKTLAELAAGGNLTLHDVLLNDRDARGQYIENVEELQADRVVSRLGPTVSVAAGPAKLLLNQQYSAGSAYLQLDAGAVGIFMSENQARMEFNLPGSQPMRLVDGYVGIGRHGPTPQYDLHVTGILHVAGTSYAERREGYGFDYAEYFESHDGKEIPSGTAVVLDGDKIRPAQENETPFGIISVNPVLVGGVPTEWPKKHLRDEFGKLIMEEYQEEVMAPKTVEKERQKTETRTITEEVTHTKVVFEEGRYREREVTETVTREVREPVFEDVEVYNDEDNLIGPRRIPVMETYAETVAEFDEDGQRVMVGTGEFVTRQRPKLNPDYDPSQEYTSREDRPEWNMVGLLGQLPLRKGQPVADTWVKIKDITDDVALWLVK